MEEKSVSNQMTASIKWSGLAEIVAKLVNPITNLILARLLAPEAFGIVATVNVVVSFADMLTDAGFQTYIIQHEFDAKEKLRDCCDVSFWSNLVLSLSLWGLIIAFRDPLASFAGSPGYGRVLAVSAAVLPITSLSSLQTGYFKRQFNFQALFRARLASVAVPLLITIPLSFLLRNYWALVIGTLAMNLLKTVILTLSSDWKPRRFYSFRVLKEMFSFCGWSLIEQISVWLTLYIGTFIVGSFLSLYYVGLYKTSMTTVNNIMNLVTSATTPILFSGLSRLQNDRSAFISTFLRFQKMVALLVLPMSVGIFLYRGFITQLLLGSQWGEAADFIGLWGLMSGVTIVMSHYSSEVFRSLGKPKLSVLSQVLHLIVLVPVLIVTARKGFTALYIARSLIRIQAVIVDLSIMWVVVGIRPWRMIRNVLGSLGAALAMSLVALLLQRLNSGVLWDLFSILVCAAAYFAFACLSADNRAIVLGLINKLKNKVGRLRKQS